MNRTRDEVDEMYAASEAYDEELAQAWGVDSEEGRQRFSVTDDHKAAWAARQYIRLERRLARRARFVADAISDLQAHQQKCDEDDQQDLAYFEGLLAEYLHRLKAEGLLGREKHWKLPGGVRLQWRAAGVAWKRVDEDALYTWAAKHRLTRTKVTTAWDTVKARLRAFIPVEGGEAVDRETGEVVPGVVIERLATDVFSVEYGK